MWWQDSVLFYEIIRNGNKRVLRNTWRYQHGVLNGNFKENIFNVKRHYEMEEKSAMVTFKKVYILMSNTLL